MFSEEDVDRELKAALSVSPSPDFEARVLRRIDVGRGLQTPALRAARILLPVAASIVIVAGLFFALNRTPGVPAPPAPQVVEHAAPAPPKTAPAAPSHIQRARPTARTRPPAPAVVARARTPQSPARAAEPEVIVPPQQLAAVRRLVREVHAGRTMPEPVQETAAGEPAVVVVIPLAIEMLTVPTLEASGGVPSIPKGLQ